jgi:transcription elongation factor Elf1
MKKATLKCRICKVPYEVKINPLQIAVDVYCQWIDECERLAQAKRKQEAGHGLGLVKNEQMTS